jgi:ADP-ribosyl-[dinitrogen reductase] hydrolase
MSSYDRILGSLLGVACGDALGATWEFKPMKAAAKAPCVYLEGGGPFDWRPGQPTDDTDQTLIVAHAIVEATSPDDIVGDVTSGLVKWHDSWPKDEGNTTRLALEQLSVGKRPPFTRAGRSSEANGSLMRSAPVGFVQGEHQRRQLAVDISSITHGSQLCIDLCSQYADAIAYLVADGKYDWKEFHTESPHRWYDGGGWAQDSWDIAWWALDHAHRYEDPVGALCDVVRLGGDADTNAAIAGGLLGAAYGASIWPKEWLSVLETRDEIMLLAAGLHRVWKGIE